ncbi:MAG TPA: dihydrodipicolinate synthase family protein [Nocardioidaceae bacterium]|nr:dihydrodipicolinate synthase family protein [Nocardioidaceae bacterium]
MPAANASRLAGVCHIMITPLRPDQSLDEEGIARVVSAAAADGVSAVVPLAIMGEAHKLLDVERRAVLDAVVSAAAGAIAVVAGISAESTYVAAARAREAAAAGVDYLMMAPPRNSVLGAGLVGHYAEVAAATSLPLVVQDEPVTTGVRLPPDFFAQVAEIPAVVAAKVEEAPSPQKISAISGAAPGLACFGGLGGVSFFEELGRGAAGTMTGFGFPRVLVDVHRAFVAGEHEKAREIFYHYLPLIRFEAQLGVGGVAIRKRLFAERGLIANAAEREPSHFVDADTTRELRELIHILQLA